MILVIIVLHVCSSKIKTRRVETPASCCHKLFYSFAIFIHNLLTVDGHAANILTYVGMYKWTIHTMSFGFFLFFCHYRP